ncbi:MAG TPA: outer membrane protein assembly factor BamE [Xanthobacteraceae bacterium]|nr:outer membrane protein assembly factor BamE [Xanthobacteraceae bacterium]
MRMPCYRPKTRHRVRTFGRTAAGLLMVGFLLGGCLTQVYQRGYVLPEGALQQVPLGASQEQVLIVLGTPSTVATLNGDVFYYISQRTEKAAAFIPDKPVDQRVIAIYFDKDRRVQRIADYGLRDGKLFDYVSRTTPTGGQEFSYLNLIFKNFFGKPGGS